MIKQANFNQELLKPKYWGYWCALPFFKLLSMLPLNVQMYLGRKLGRCIPKIGAKRAQVAKINIEKCFPELSSSEHHTLWIKNLEETGCAFFDTLNAWFWSDKKVARHMNVEGLEHLASLDPSQGILYFSIHSLPLEMGARIIGLSYSGYGVYRPHNNSFMEYIQLKGRLKASFGMIPKRDTRSIIRTLRNGGNVWYTADQDVGDGTSIFAPFLGVQEASTITATSTFARLGKAKLLPFFVERDAQNIYQLKLEPIIHDFPKGCEEQDTHRVNHMIGTLIKKNISQYLWMHRRFKKRPEHDKTDFYASLKK